MQEDVENRTINVVIKTTKLSGKAMIKLMMSAVKFLKGVQKTTNDVANKISHGKHGKQSVKKLIGQNQGVSSVEIAKTQLRDFERIARKYGVDFAIKKDRSEMPPKYFVFFKAKDADALPAAVKEFSAKSMQKTKRPSILKELYRLKEKVASIPKKTRNKNQERDL